MFLGHTLKIITILTLLLREKNGNCLSKDQGNKNGKRKREIIKDLGNECNADMVLSFDLDARLFKFFFTLSNPLKDNLLFMIIKLI